MTKLLSLSIFFSLLYLGCAPKISSTFIESIDNIEIQYKNRNQSYCNDQLAYIPDSLTTMKTVRVNVHFMDDSKGDKNFSMDAGKKYMNALLDNANKRLDRNEKMKLPLRNNTPVIPINYRYKIVAATDDPDDDGFYKHHDDTLFYFLNKGKHRNNYNRDVINKYRIGADSIINIFVLPHHPDSVKSSTYKAHKTGIALGSDLKVSGLFEKPDKPWELATLLNHEIGHIFGLSHSWIRNDRCDDTPQHPNCWDNTRPPPCDSLLSNNMMDYNNSQMALSPCQLGIINKGFSKLNHKNRKLLVVDWCEKKDNSEIIIKDSVQWLGAKDVQQNIRILPGGVFEVFCRIGMAKNTKIIVEPGGTLKLSGAYLHNSCNYQWQGIEVLSKGDVAGIVEAFGNVRIENVVDESQQNSQKKTGALLPNF